MENLLTLKQVRERIQFYIDQGQQDKAQEGLRLLKELGISVNAISESPEERIERIKIAVITKLREKGMNARDATVIVDNNFDPKLNEEKLLEHLMRIPQVRAKLNPN